MELCSMSSEKTLQTEYKFRMSHRDSFKIERFSSSSKHEGSFLTLGMQRKSHCLSTEARMVLDLGFLLLLLAKGMPIIRKKRAGSIC